MNEKVFTEGIIFKLPSDRAPEFVRGSISFKTEEAINWITQHTENEWCNIDLLVGRNGKPYSALNTYKPNQDTAEYSPKTDPKHNGSLEDDIPF